MESIDIMLMCIYAPFALAALWVVGCLFFGRTDLVPKFIARWFGRGEKSRLRDDDIESNKTTK